MYGVSKKAGVSGSIAEIRPPREFAPRLYMRPSLDTHTGTHDNTVAEGPSAPEGASPHVHVDMLWGVRQIMASALHGMTILDLTDGPAGAIATMLLCDHGARVIRVVERHETISRQGGYLVWDRGKACLQLALAQIVPPAQRREPPDATTRTYERLIRTADVLVESYAPAAPQQALVASDWLSRLNPRLVHCSITAYGKRGPLKDEPPIDDLVMARLGILGSQPGFRPPPVHVVHPLPTVGAALLAAQGITAALLARESTGLGRQVETSLMAGALMYHPKVMAEKLAPNVFQTHPSGSAPFYSVYACADGQWVQLGCVHAGFIKTAATVMGIQEALQEPRFNNGRPAQDTEADRDLRALVANVSCAGQIGRAHV